MDKVKRTLKNTHHHHHHQLFHITQNNKSLLSSAQSLPLPSKCTLSPSLPHRGLQWASARPVSRWLQTAALLPHLQDLQAGAQPPLLPVWPLHPPARPPLLLPWHLRRGIQPLLLHPLLLLCLPRVSTFCYSLCACLGVVINPTSSYAALLASLPFVCYSIPWI